MTVKEVGSTRFRFQGLSTDEKPLTDVQDGATFHVVDTGEKYIFHDGAWEQDISAIMAVSEGMAL